MELTMQSWMIETLERTIQLGDAPAEILEKRRRMMPKRSERHAREPGHQADEVP